MTDDFPIVGGYSTTQRSRLILLPWNRPSSAGEQRATAWVYIGTKNNHCSFIGGRTAVEGFSRTAVLIKKVK